ncbi:MAG: 23S rRNA (guanosine(2251)-2'-O)-methyltransferase RlmB [Gammaproteobacteria bacterium]
MAKSQQEVIYGLHPVESALRNNRENVLQLWVQQGRNDGRIRKLIDLANSAGISIEAISADKLSNKCQGERHQGVVARLRAGARKQLEFEDLLERDQLLVLILDEVQDPHNIGACLRTADAVGADAVIVSKNRSPGLTPVVVKVASGAADHTPYIQVSNLARALEKLRAADVWIIGTSGDTETGLYDCQVAQRMAVVMGSEGKGMRRLTREACDELVAIPMQGSVESLNVSVASGVTLFELRRRMNSLT